MSKRSVIQRNDGYLMLLDAVYFNGKRIGNISEEGLDWSGEDAQTVELWAAQIRTNPVLDIETRAATNEITGKMIETIPHARTAATAWLYSGWLQLVECTSCRPLAAENSRYISDLS